MLSVDQLKEDSDKWKRHFIDSMKEDGTDR